MIPFIAYYTCPSRTGQTFPAAVSGWELWGIRSPLSNNLSWFARSSCHIFTLQVVYRGKAQELLHSNECKPGEPISIGHRGQPSPAATSGRLLRHYRAWVFTMQTQCKHPVKFKRARLRNIEMEGEGCALAVKLREKWLSHVPWSRYPSSPGFHLLKLGSSVRGHF
jgi:hypothetical protein